MAAAQQTQEPTQVTAPAGDSVAQVQGLLEQVLDRTERARGEILLTPRGIDFGNFEGLVRWARYISASGLAPVVGTGADKHPMGFEQVLICIVLGRSVGLDPFQAVQNIAVINGRPTLWGDAPLAVCRQHPTWVESGFREYYLVGGKPQATEPDPKSFQAEDTAAVCESLRKGQTEPHVSRFSMAHAKAAGLTSKNGSLYGLYGQRMLRFRARGYNLRDNFGDALKGLGIKELLDGPEDGQPTQTEPPVGRIRLGNGTPRREPEPVAVAPEDKPADDQEPTKEEYEAAAPEPTPPSDEPTLDETLAGIGRLIEAAASEPDFQEAGRHMVRHREAMGPERYASFERRYQERRKEVLKPKPGSLRERANF